jgi:poly(hydroxyalkanoate) depolymerase family esterase
MTQAQGLVRQGQLTEAMAVIQSAMGGGAAPAPPRDGGDIIDIEAREVQADQPRTQSGQFTMGSHSEKAGTRACKLYIPPHHQEGAPKKLVVMLHGCTQDPDDFAAGTRMNEAAQAQGFFVLYPAQAQNANTSRCWNWFKHNHQQRDRGEPAILAGMVRQVIGQHHIDPRQVYVAGLSAGGAMAAILGAAYPELFAAVGVHSGLPVGSATDAPSAFAAMKSGGNGRALPACPPTIVFHGDRDHTVHPVNGQRVIAAARPGASPHVQSVRDDQGRPFTRHTYADAQGRTVAEHWLVHGAGHAWSGGSAQGSYADPLGPSATQEMLRFFSEHTLAH